MQYRLQYAQARPASYDPGISIWERKECVIEADTPAEAEEAAELFLAGRKKISLFPSCPLPVPVLMPFGGYLSGDEIF
ncbi:MAG: hypothetical protein ACYC48_01700 [Minisyncoccota bacterium]